MHFYKLKHEQNLRRTKAKDKCIDLFFNSNKDQSTKKAEPKVLKTDFPYSTFQWIWKQKLHKQVRIFSVLQPSFLAILFVTNKQ